MKMTWLSLPPPNLNLIQGVYNSLGSNSLTLFGGNHWNTWWLLPYYLILPLLKRGTISNTLSSYHSVEMQGTEVCVCPMT